MKRLHALFNHEVADQCSVHWKMLKEQVLKQTGLEPFAQVDDIRASGFRYLSSTQRSERFEILEGDAPYTATTDWAASAATALPEDAGPVEIDVASFMLDPRADLGLLIGGMGSGKSTTLRQMTEWLKTKVQVHYINCDKKALDPRNPPSTIELLVRFLNPLAANLVGAEEEFSACWNWALAQYGSQNAANHHSAVTVIEPAAEVLRVKYGEQLRRCDPEAVQYRREHLYERVCATPGDKLDYIALRLDYYLTEICRGERNRVCIVLDNVDPLPPLLQRELLLNTSQLQLNAQCKVLLAMRPLTYSLTHEQRATRTVKVIQHIGPSPLALIEDRVNRLIEARDCSTLRLRVQTDGAVERDLTQQDFKAWVRQVIEDIKASRPSGGSRSPEVSASDFIEGLCNNSLRSALLVAEKVFGSPNLPMVLPDEPPASDGSHTTILKNHEIVRAVLLGKHAHYVGDLARVTDNIFDLGDATSCFSATCKYRLLKELACAPGRGILPLDDVHDRLKSFGYDEQTMLEAVNGVIAQTKRLAWSDMVVRYQSLSEPAGSKLSISRAGRFYVDHAIYTLEYVQEVHIDVLLPEQVAGTTYNHRNFVDRANSLYRFMRYLHEADVHEVQRAMSDPSSQKRYFDTYGAGLFSSAMARALAPQITKIGNSMLRKLRSGDQFGFEIQQALAQWRSLDAAYTSEDEGIVQCLQKFKHR